ncbi:MAG: T9SS type A sorting domain-containing protein [Elusimicrobia bacterium]|nr:T9SS type A sorting domain-containing protein [Elusimicrobiota bacterium]
MGAQSKSLYTRATTFFALLFVSAAASWAQVAVAVSTPNFPADGGFVNIQPNFNWLGPSTGTVAAFPAGSAYLLEVATNDPAFGAGNIAISVTAASIASSTSVPTADGAYVSTFTLANNTTYYWRVAARDNVGTLGPWSSTYRFRTDFTIPSGSGFTHISSTAGVLGETQLDTLVSGVTVQLVVQDAGLGLAVSTSAIPYAGDGHVRLANTSGFGVSYSVDAGQSWNHWASASSVLSVGGVSGILSLAEFNGMLYAGTDASGRVYQSADGTNWTLVLSGTSEQFMGAFATFKGRLYVGTYPNGMVYSTADGGSWTVSLSGKGESYMDTLVEFNGKLFAGSYPSGKLFATDDGSTWTEVFAAAGENQITSLAAFNGRLYAGTSLNGKVLVSTNGVNWSTSFSGSSEQTVSALTTFNGKLYAGTYFNAKVYSTSDGVTWTNVLSGTNEQYIQTMTAFNGALYVGTYPSGKILVTSDGSNWRTALSNTGQNEIASLAGFNGALYAGTFGANGKVYQLSPIPATLTGADGTATAQTLSAPIDLASSTNTVTCGGVSPCAATNQVLFHTSDLAGNSKTFGPFAVIADSAGPTVSVTSLTPFGSNLSVTASATDYASGVKDYNFEASTAANFGGSISSSNFIAVSSFSFFNLLSDTTYFVRVTARDNLLNAGTSVAGSTKTFGTVFFNATNVAPGNVPQAAETAFLKFSLNTPLGSTATFNGALIHRTGTAADADIVGAKIYLDDGDGTFNSSLDTELGNAAFSGIVSSITLLTPQPIVATAKNFFVVLPMSSLATVGDTVGVAIDVSTAIVLNAPFQAVGTFPSSSSNGTIQDGPNYLQITPTSVSPATVSPGSAGVSVLKLSAQSNVGTSILNNVHLKLGGTIASNHISAVKIYRDLNGSGVLDAGDSLLTSGSDVFTAGESTPTFSAPQSTLTFTPAPSQLFVVVDVAASAAAGETFWVYVATPTDLRLVNPSDAVVFVSSPVASSTTTVQSPNFLTVSLSSLAPTTFTQGSKYAVLKATMTVTNGTAQVNQMQINRTGVSVDADVNAVEIWQDPSPLVDGGVFNPAVDVRLGTAAFASGLATINITTATLSAGTTFVFLVVYDVSATATVGNSLGGKMNSSSFVNSPTATTVVGNFPFSSSTGTVAATVNHLVVTPLDQSPGSLLQGATNVALLRVKAYADQNAVIWSGLNIQRLGSSSDGEVDAISIYRDADANGVLNAGDTLVTSGIDTFSSGQANVAFTTPQTITPSTQTYFVAIAVDPNTVPGNTMGVRLSTTSAFNINSPNLVSTAALSFPIDAGPTAVQQFPNTVTVTTASIAGGSFNPGTQNIGMMKLTLKTDVSQAQLLQLRVDRTGVSSDADVKSVKIYYDINQLGVFNPATLGQYQLLTATTPTFGDAGIGSVNLALSPNGPVTTSGRTYFVVIDLSTSATPGNTIGVRAVNSSYYTVSAPNTMAATSFASASITVNAPPSLMYVTGASSAPTSAVQGTASIPMVTFRAWMGQYTGQWSGLTVVRTGSGADADVDRLKIYLDSNANGTLDTLTDTVVATGTFSGGQAVMGFLSVQAMTVSTQTYFLTADVSPVGTPGDTVGVSLTSPGAFTVAPPNGTSSIGFPINSGLVTVGATQNGVSVGFQDKAPVSVTQGATQQVLLSLQMDTTSNVVLWNSLVLTQTGTALDQDVSAIHVMSDLNANGLVDSGDVEVTSGLDRFVSGSATIFLASPQQVSPTPSKFLISVDLHQFAASTATVGVSIASATSIGVPSPNFVIDSGFPMASTLSPIRKLADRLVVGFTDLIPTGIGQGTTVAVARMTAYAQRDRLNWTQVRFVKTGGIPDAQITQARVYADTNNDGQFGAGDVQVGTGTFSGGLTTITFSSVQAMTKSTATYFVTVTLDPNATVGASIGLTATDASAFTVQSPDLVSSQGLPFATALSTVLDVRTPLTPTVVPESNYWSRFDSLHFTWSSSVGSGTIAGAMYAIGTTAGGTNIQPYTAIGGLASDVTARGLALQSGSTYYVSVKATSSLGYTSPVGVSVPVLVDLTVPTAPGLSVTLGAQSVQATWAPSLSGPTGLMGYLVEYRTGAAPLWRNAKTGQVSTSQVMATRVESIGPLAISSAALFTGNAASFTPPVGTVFVRVSGVSGAGVQGPVSGVTQTIFGTLPAGGISEVTNYPNPFDSRTNKTTINFTLSTASTVVIRIYNIFGGKIREINASGAAGSNDVIWDGADDGGKKVSKGLYVAVLEGGGAKVTRKIGVIH